MLKRYRNGILPARADELAPEVDKAVAATARQLQEHQLQSALESIWRLVNRANQYVEQAAPFKLAKDPGQAARLDQVLYNLAEVCRVLAGLLLPVLPATARKNFLRQGPPGAPRRFSPAPIGRVRRGPPH